jgi:hypothetical protein
LHLKQWKVLSRRLAALGTTLRPTIRCCQLHFEGDTSSSESEAYRKHSAGTDGMRARCTGPPHDGRAICRGFMADFTRPPLVKGLEQLGGELRSVSRTGSRAPPLKRGPPSPTRRHGFRIGAARSQQVPAAHARHATPGGLGGPRRPVRTVGRCASRLVHARHSGGAGGSPAGRRRQSGGGISCPGHPATGLRVSTVPQKIWRSACQPAVADGEWKVLRRRGAA